LRLSHTCKSIHRKIAGEWGGWECGGKKSLTTVVGAAGAASTTISRDIPCQGRVRRIFHALAGESGERQRRNVVEHDKFHEELATELVGGCAECKKRTCPDCTERCTYCLGALCCSITKNKDGSCGAAVTSANIQHQKCHQCNDAFKYCNDCNSWCEECEKHYCIPCTKQFGPSAKTTCNNCGMKPGSDCGITCVRHSEGLWVMCDPPLGLDCDNAYCTSCAETMICPDTNHCQDCATYIRDNIEYEDEHEGDYIQDDYD